MVRKPPPGAITAKTSAEWQAWLETNHDRGCGVWLIRLRRGELSLDEAVEQALCYGWIDSLPRPLDRARTMLWFAPRRARTKWSRQNKERAERLIAEGKMHPAGLAKVEAAKLDGSWFAWESVEEIDTPPDLACALDRYASARTNFEAFPRYVRRAILEWILSAPQSDVRARRVDETAACAQRNERANLGRTAFLTGTSPHAAVSEISTDGSGVQS